MFDKPTYEFGKIQKITCKIKKNKVKYIRKITIKGENNVFSSWAWKPRTRVWKIKA